MQVENPGMCCFKTVRQTGIILVQTCAGREIYSQQHFNEAHQKLTALTVLNRSSYQMKIQPFHCHACNQGSVNETKGFNLNCKSDYCIINTFILKLLQTHTTEKQFDLLVSHAPAPLLSHHAKSFKASVASLAQPLQPHQPPAAGHNSACPLVWDSQEGSRARTPRTPKHPEQLEVPSSHPASQQNNQNTENL